MLSMIRHLFFLCVALSVSSIIFILYNPIYDNAYHSYNPAIFKNLRLNKTTGLYEFNGKPIIWQYWHSDQVPLYVRLLYEAIQCRNPEFQVILVHDSTVYDYINFIPERLLSVLSSQHKSHLFRVAILQTYGGVYVDVSALPLDRLYEAYQFFFEPRRNWRGLTPNWKHLALCPWMIGPISAKSNFMGFWKSVQMLRMKNKFAPRMSKSKKRQVLEVDPFDDDDLLETTLNDYSKRHKAHSKQYFVYNGEKTVGQLIDLEIAIGEPLSSNLTNTIFPLKNWSPFLLYSAHAMEEQLGASKKLDELLPTNVTLYSVFVNRALSMCRREFENMIGGGTSETPISGLNLVELLQLMDRMDPKIIRRVGDRSFNYEEIAQL